MLARFCSTCFALFNISDARNPWIPWNYDINFSQISANSRENSARNQLFFCVFGNIRSHYDLWPLQNELRRDVSWTIDLQAKQSAYSLFIFLYSDTHLQRLSHDVSKQYPQLVSDTMLVAEVSLRKSYLRIYSWVERHFSHLHRVLCDLMLL